MYIIACKNALNNNVIISNFLLLASNDNHLEVEILFGFI